MEMLVVGIGWVVCGVGFLPVVCGIVPEFRHEPNWKLLVVVALWPFVMATVCVLCICTVIGRLRGK